MLWKQMLFSAVMTTSLAAAQESQKAGAPTISYTYERKEMAIPYFQITIDRDGKGIYRADLGPAGIIDKPVSISEATTKKVWDLASATKGFRAAPCETRLKNIAQTGKKTLKWTGEGETGQCTFNYSDDKNIQAVSEVFIAVAWTMESGFRLERQKRFDRLGLDAEMTALTNAVKDGHATEVHNIAPVLQSIVADQSLMERVRTKAEALLTSTK